MEVDICIFGLCSCANAKVQIDNEYRICWCGHIERNIRQTLLCGLCRAAGLNNDEQHWQRCIAIDCTIFQFPAIIKFQFPHVLVKFFVTCNAAPASWILLNTFRTIHESLSIYNTHTHIANHFSHDFILHTCCLWSAWCQNWNCMTFYHFNISHSHSYVVWEIKLYLFPMRFDGEKRNVFVCTCNIFFNNSRTILPFHTCQINMLLGWRCRHIRI